MSTSISFPILGLATDMNPSVAPKGSLSVAENVVCDLPGVARQRPNCSIIYEYAGAVARPSAILSYLAEWMAYTPGDGWRNKTGAIAAPTGADPVNTFYGAPTRPEFQQQGAAMRGNFYVTSLDGVAKLSGDPLDVPLAGPFKFSGLEMNVAPTGSLVSAPRLSSGISGPLTSPFAVGYRIVIKRTDDNGYVVRSPPSSTFNVNDSGGAAANGVLLAGPPGGATPPSWYFRPGDLLEGDVIEFYRSRISADAAGPIGPDYYLANSYSITAGDVAAGVFPTSISLFDQLTDDSLGEALYTNPGVGGALSAKYTPPVAVALAPFQRCMWYGAVNERSRLLLRFVNTTPFTGVAPDSTYFGYHVIETGTITSGSANITGVVSVTGIRVGQYITRSADGPETATGQIPALTRIVGITGAGPYTIQMSVAATGNHAITIIAPARVADIVVVTTKGGDVPFFGWNTVPNGTFQTFDTSASSADTTVNVITSAYSFQRVVNYYSALNDTGFRVVGAQPLVTGGAGGANGQVIIESARVGWASFAVTSASTAPEAFEPNLRKTIQSDVTQRDARLYWSLPDEPEAVPVLNFADVGDQRSPILRLVPLRDAMLVFKSDGVYRVSGTAPGNWNIDLVDSTARLLRPECVDVGNGMAYALTQRGLCEMTESGVRQITSDGKVNEDLSVSLELIYNANMRGCTVVSWEEENLVIVTLPNVGGDELLSNGALVYCTLTGAWSRWPRAVYSCGVRGGTNGPLFAAGRVSAPGGPPLFEIRGYRPERGSFDAVYPGVPRAGSAGFAMTIPMATAGSWEPAIGDLVSAGATGARVIDVNTSGSDWILTLDVSAPLTGTVTAYEVPLVILEWMPSVSASASPFSRPVWRAAEFSFQTNTGDTTGGSARLVFSVRHNGDATLPEVVATPARAAVPVRPYRIGWPRNASRRPVVWPRLSFAEASWVTNIAGVCLIGEGGSERTTR